MLSVEILDTQHTSARGKRMLHALEEARPSDVRIVSHQIYTSCADWLVLFGAGGTDRYPAYLRHRASGRRTVVFDLGYWERENYQRVAVDAEHCHRYFYRVAPTRPGYPCRLRDDYDPSGPILYAAMGQKSKNQYGADYDDNAIRELRESGHDVIVRPKPSRKCESGLPPIEEALRGCSRVVTHHSNVAIDGIIAGIPHECADGAAFAFKSNMIVRAKPEARRDFLDRLGMWQWKPSEAKELWGFLRSLPE